MKRFTLILSLLVAMVTTTMAQSSVWQRTATTYSAEQLNVLTEATYIAVKNLSGTNGRYLAANENVENFGYEAVLVWEPAVENTAGAYHIRRLSAGENGYIQEAASGAVTLGEKATAQVFVAVTPNAPSNETLNDDNNGILVRFKQDGADTWLNCQKAASTPVLGNTGQGGWTVHNVYGAEEITEVANVTYTFTYGGETIATQTTTVEKGAAYPAIDTTIIPFGFTATAPDGIVNEEDIEEIIELTATFSWADSYENITAWYYLDLKDGKYLFYEEGKENIPLNKTSVDSNNKDAYTWGFIGDPVNGFQIVNYAAGSEMILSSSTTMAGTEGGGTYPVMTTMPVPEDNNTHWVFTASTDRTNGFFIGQKGYASNILNNRDNILAYWTGGADGGSTFIMIERPMGATAELEALIAEIEAMNIVAGTNIGDYTEASVNALNDAVATAKAVETATADDVAALQAALDALAIVSPSTDKVYAFNVYYNGFGYYLYSKIDGSTGIYTQGTSNVDTNALWQFVEAEGGYNIKNVHTNLFISNSVTMTDVESEYGLFVVTRYNTEGGVKGTANEGKAYIKFAGDTEYCIHSYNTETAKSWYGTGLGNQVGIEEVSEFSHTLTVTTAEWATIVLGFNATIPTADGFKAYKIASEEDGYVTLEEVTGVLQANVPVLVNAPAENYNFAYTTDEAKVTESGLQGTLYNKDITVAGAYVLGLIDGEAGFGLATTTGKAEGTFTNNANKAYFVPTNTLASAASYSFRFGEGTTGVEKVEIGNEKSEIYDLTGRRVETITEPGIYIVGGKKVLVK